MEQEQSIGKAPERKITVIDPKTGIKSVFNRNDSDAGIAGELMAELGLEVAEDNQIPVQKTTPIAIDRLTG